MKRMRRVRVYRVVSMIEMDTMATSDNEACQIGLDIAVKPETAFRRPNCKFVAVAGLTRERIIKPRETS
jgi:hypothetical protein